MIYGNGLSALSPQLLSAQLSTLSSQLFPLSPSALRFAVGCSAPRGNIKKYLTLSDPAISDIPS
jgi:hypothetical protein